ncbi:ASTRA-associated protein 1, partial [Lasiodiplodia hormozganensis]
MSDAPQLQRPPAQPAYVLRGHHAHVHAVRFLRHNERLLTGDADGWVVLWNVATKRAVAVWRAHDGAILGFGTWPEDKVITHGRDFHLRVWQLGPADEHDFSTALPVDDTTTHRKQPWLLHSLRVNTLNFCSFAACPEHPDASNDSPPSVNPILIAVPGMKDGEVDVFQLPTEHRMSTVPNIGQKTGMTMSVSLMHSRPSPSSGPVLHCIAGYESGATAVHVLSSATNTWSHIYTSQPHSQPLLSLSPTPPSSSSDLTFYTSGADDLIAKHTLSAPPSPFPPKPPSSPPAAAPSTPTPTKPQYLLSAA